jgi:hypothetical protein
VVTIAIPPELKLGQEMLHGDLQIFHSDLVDMHKLTPQIEEVVQFQRKVNR